MFQLYIFQKYFVVRFNTKNIYAFTAALRAGKASQESLDLRDLG